MRKSKDSNSYNSNELRFPLEIGHRKKVFNDAKNFNVPMRALFHFHLIFQRDIVGEI
jgi:hypothetical protein